ncbi:RsmE family RNA methyltransferase [Lagierella sp.]|uniref:RsmE family RNA methyltransferase n=1 Tax=Lagierella sp. TaxID=2849657 RepID=UPI0026134028|nr:RsmE family RNA methyltransferase [Lagierella sp.]
MYRFFIDDSNLKDNEIFLYGEDFHHAKNVLRLNLGENLELVCGDVLYFGEVSEITKEDLIIKIMSKEVLKEKLTTIRMFQGLPKGDKFEYIIQKAVELGVDEIIPFESERTIVKYKEKSYSKKQVRYEKIIKAAAMQSKRNHIPKLHLPISFDQIKKSEMGLGLLAFEASEKPLKNLLRDKKDIREIDIVIGPEGGFSQKEVSSLGNQGFYSISLGKRILRTETASLNLLSIIGYELER